MVDLSKTALKIASARKEKGFTQEELAVRLGVSSQAVSKWERALSLPDVDLLIDLSQILDMTLENLLIADNDSVVSAPMNTTVYDVCGSTLTNQSINDQMIIVSFGTGLIPVFTSKGIAEFPDIRKRVLQDMGVLLPTFRIMDKSELPQNQCVLTLFGTVAWCKIYEEVTDEIYIDIINHITSVIINRLPDFVNRHMVKLLVENIKIGMPFLIDGVIPERIDLSTLRTLLKSLVSNGISIRNLVNIIEIADELMDEIKDRKILKDVLIKRLKNS